MFCESDDGGLVSEDVVMSIWISQQMANNLMKWWKTKFLNGYRQFSGKGYLPLHEWIE